MIPPSQRTHYIDLYIFSCKYHIVYIIESFLDHSSTRFTQSSCSRYTAHTTHNAAPITGRSAPSTTYHTVHSLASTIYLWWMTRRCASTASAVRRLYTAVETMGRAWRECRGTGNISGGRKSKTNTILFFFFFFSFFSFVEWFPWQRWCLMRSPPIVHGWMRVSVNTLGKSSEERGEMGRRILLPFF